MLSKAYFVDFKPQNDIAVKETYILCKVNMINCMDYQCTCLWPLLSQTVRSNRITSQISSINMVCIFISSLLAVALICHIGIFNIIHHPRSAFISFFTIQIDILTSSSTVQNSLKLCLIKSIHIKNCVNLTPIFKFGTATKWCGGSLIGAFGSPVVGRQSPANGKNCNGVISRKMKADHETCFNLPSSDFLWQALTKSRCLSKEHVGFTVVQILHIYWVLSTFFTVKIFFVDFMWFKMHPTQKYTR